MIKRILPLRHSFQIFCLTIVSIKIDGFLIDNYGFNKFNLPVPLDSAHDKPLFLTPFIEKGDIKEAQKLATVPPLLEKELSFSGFLTVNKNYSSNLFFWFFASQLPDWEAQPIVIWLQGGPGASSLFGLFTENGPFSVGTKLQLTKRDYSWNKKYNVIYVDNPVGAGFSFTEKSAGYTTNESEVAKDLYEAILQFLKLFPSLQKNRLYISGESYAGKYIPAIAYKIYKSNPDASLKINLSGLFIGNGFTDPFNQLEYGDYLYHLGFIDEIQERILNRRKNYICDAINHSEFQQADRDFSTMLDSAQRFTGFGSIYNFVDDTVGNSKFPEAEFLNDHRTRKAIHVGNVGFHNGHAVYFHLIKDIMRSVKPWVEELLTAEQFPILFYSGQFDVIVAYPLSLKFYNALQWPRAEDYKSATRGKFRVGLEVAGYGKKAGTFTEVLLRNAGHMVPTDQPKWAFELLDRFITNCLHFEE